MRRGVRALAAAVGAGASIAAAPAQAGGCDYRTLGSIPLHWDGLRPTIAGAINGQPVPMVLDTGALSTLVSGRVAARAGLQGQPVEVEQVGFGGVTAARGARAAEISFGAFRWRDVGVLVPAQAADDLPDVLVSAGFLFQHDLELDAGRVSFLEPGDCEEEHPSGWAAGAPWLPMQPMGPRDLRVTVPVVVDGVALRALVDSGSPLSMIDLAAARGLGFDPGRAGTLSGRGGGVGAHLNTQWVAPFRAVVIGPEAVREVPLVVTDLWGSGASDLAQAGRPAGAQAAAALPQPQMILGADFLKSHRVLFAASQHRLYFAFTGGKVFQAMSMTHPAAARDGAGAGPPAAADPAPARATAPVGQSAP
jgi:predicted aspartyl protease